MAFPTIGGKETGQYETFLGENVLLPIVVGLLGSLLVLYLTGKLWLSRFICTSPREDQFIYDAPQQ